MEHILTSWKEIANYLGKGVRTVQRWEHQSGLPIHRPNEQLRNVVVTTTTDLDSWVAAGRRTYSEIADENELLRERVRNLELEVAKLRDELQERAHRTPGDNQQINKSADLIKGTNSSRRAA